MAIGCGPKIAKFILIAFNILFWLSGLILIIIGAVFLTNGTMKYVDEIINANTNRNILIGFIIIGSIIFVIGFCGCCGAIKESKCLLAIYIILVIIIIVAECAFGIFAIIKRQPIEDEFVKSLKDNILKYYGNKDITVNQAIDRIQEGIGCCGVELPADWKNSDWYKNQTTEPKEQVPRSCFKPLQNTTTFPDGCVPMFKKYAKQYFPAVIGVALGIAFFEIFVVICAFCLCRNTDIHSQSV